MAKKEEEEVSLFDDLDFAGFDEDEDTFIQKADDKEDDNEDKEDIKKKKTPEKENEFFEVDSDESEEETDTDTKVDEEEQEEKEKDAKHKKDTPSDKNSSSSFLQVLAKSLYEEGVLSSFDEKTEIKKASDFIEIINNEIVTSVEAYKAELPEEIKTLIDVYEEGVPLDKLLNVRSKKIEYSQIAADKLSENEDLMKQLIREDLKNRGYEDDDIKEKLSDIVALDKTEIEAKKALSSLKKKQENDEKTLVESEKKRRDEEIKKRDANIVAMKDAIEKTSEFAGIQLTKQHKQEIFNNLMKPVGELSGRPVNAITKAQAENPAEFQKNLAMAWTLTKGFTDWSSFGKVTKSKTLSELEEAARKTAEKIKPGKVVRGEIDDEDNESPGGFLKNIRL